MVLLSLMSNSNARGQELWNYCSILRDDGLPYGDYVEHLTFLLFLKFLKNHMSGRGVQYIGYVIVLAQLELCLT